MPFVQRTGIEHDLFISYAHANDQSVYQNGNGWVTQFIVDLTAQVRQDAGRVENLDVWSDHKLPGNQDFQETIRKACASTAVLVLVVSESYVSSPHCLDEWKTFTQYSDRQAAPNSARGRIFKVNYSPVPPERQPLTDWRISASDFFEFIDLSGVGTALLRKPGEDPDQRYRKKIAVLSSRIAECLKSLNTGSGLVAPPPAHSVYLGYAPRSLTQVRDELAATLARDSLEILWSESETDAARAEHLRSSIASIHFPASGCTKNEQERILEEYDAVGKGRRDKGFQQLIVADADYHKAAAKLDSFAGKIEALRNGETAPASQLVNASPPEALEGVLRALGKPTTTRLKQRRIPPKVHIACSRDLFAEAANRVDPKVRNLASYLHERKGMDVSTSTLAEDKTDFKSQVVSAAGVILIYSKDSKWLRQRAESARAIAARRVRQPLACSICDAPPKEKSPLSDFLQVHDVIVILCQEDLDKAVGSVQLEAFVNRITNSEK